MSPSYAEVEDRLARSYQAFVAEVPEDPPVSWSAYRATPERLRRQWHHIVGVAASIVLILLATALWASPSAGARYHGAEELRVRSPGIAQLQRTHLCPCSSTL
jgi:hypothetical protein